jgi:hypothetical protein
MPFSRADVHPSSALDTDELAADPTAELDCEPALFRVHTNDAVDVEVAHVVPLRPAGHVRPLHEAGVARFCSRILLEIHF